MLFKIAGAALYGVQAYLVEVEVDIALGVPDFVMVGLPDKTVRESRERVKTALKNCGFPITRRKIMVNLAPADRKKEGTAFDLPISLGLLAHLDAFPSEHLKDFLFTGELALDGRLKSVPGILPAAVLAKKKKYKGIVIPKTNEKEAALVKGLGVYALNDINEVISLLNKSDDIKPSCFDVKRLLRSEKMNCDFKDIKGQKHCKRALEVAAAGGHNVLMVGPPGAGKTMMARRLPTIMPPMTFEEILEATQIYSVSGLLGNRGAVVRRPFRSPHHTTSDAGLIGGGMIPKPGDVSLAHHGVLFLDELPEFRKKVLESLRQPMEDGQVTISRASMTVTYPCSFMLVASMNPCQDTHGSFPGSEYECTDSQKNRYYSKISGPLLDRIDIHLEVPKVEYKEISSGNEGESSEAIRQRVVKARNRQLNRFRKQNIFCNAEMGVKQVKRFCKPDQAGEELLHMAVDKLGFSARAYDRVLKVARTITDLEGAEELSSAHISEAVQYRMWDKYFR
ncbi:MAG: YifB family Mg chelatase-like AAA ATPase [Candidatus Aminicenantes bacterium]|nr:YifB family Mg chelatase-like AAA ATPase [Candidatus Aminicenantes bacterium]